MRWNAGHDRQRELFSNDAEPCEPPRARDDEGGCQWGGCSNDAVTTRPGMIGRIDVCDDHRVRDPRPEPTNDGSPRF